jgi:topoisomerase-4 subunit A
MAQAAPGFLWLHMNLSHAASARWLRAHGGLSESFFEALVDGSRSARIERDEDALFAVLNDVTFDFSFDAKEVESLWVNVTRSLVITARRRPLRSVDRLRTSVRNGAAMLGSVELLDHLLRDQADELQRILRRASERLDDIEDEVLAGRHQHHGTELAGLRRLMVREIEADAKTFADARRTLIQAEKKAMLEVKVIDEPVTVVVSSKGWVRARQGHGHEAASFAFKAGDGLYDAFECRTVDTLLIFGSNGRIYSVAVATLPGARGDGQPVTTLIDLESGTQPVHYFAGPAGATLLLSGSGGYGFLATIESMVSRNKAGKAFVSLADGESLCMPSHVSLSSATVSPDRPALPAASHVACASTGGRVLTFAIDELKLMEKGGRGLMLIDLEAKDTLAGAAAYTRSVKIQGIGRGGKAREETLEIRSLNNAKAGRAKKGRVADLGFKPNRVSRVE